ncbi:DsbA family oxidoreductase [Allohahella marinimesophila]|uniref:DsbA family oxidoreductase n=1 Tax=Allohahella marinimesophila TaxID=1054972 RepID=A0ABP7NGM4_9GAMM
MTTAAMTTLKIDMVSDVVCPWCIIGYQRLQQALKQYPDLKVELTFQPFELNPNMPPEGQNINEHIAEKYGSDEATIEHNRQQMRSLGMDLGITFDTDAGSRIWNTFMAHKLLMRAEQLGRQTPLAMALFEAYFSERKNVSDPEILVDIAAKNGLSREEAQTALDDEALGQQVRALEDDYRRVGVSAVPTFIFNDMYSVSGAQDPVVLGKVIAEILDKNDSRG